MPQQYSKTPGPGGRGYYTPPHPSVSFMPQASDFTKRPDRFAGSDGPPTLMSSYPTPPSHYDQPTERTGSPSLFREPSPTGQPTHESSSAVPMVDAYIKNRKFIASQGLGSSTPMTKEQRAKLVNMARYRRSCRSPSSTGSSLLSFKNEVSRVSNETWKSLGYDTLASRQARSEAKRNHRRSTRLRSPDKNGHTRLPNIGDQEDTHRTADDTRHVLAPIHRYPESRVYGSYGRQQQSSYRPSNPQGQRQDSRRPSRWPIPTTRVRTDRHSAMQGDISDCLDTGYVARTQSCPGGPFESDLDQDLSSIQIGIMSRRDELESLRESMKREREKYIGMRYQGHALRSLAARSQDAADRHHRRQQIAVLESQMDQQREICAGLTDQVVRSEVSTAGDNTLAHRLENLYTGQRDAWTGRYTSQTNGNHPIETKGYKKTRLARRRTRKLEKKRNTQTSGLSSHSEQPNSHFTATDIRHDLAPTHAYPASGTYAYGQQQQSYYQPPDPHVPADPLRSARKAASGTSTGGRQTASRPWTDYEEHLARLQMNIMTDRDSLDSQHESRKQSLQDEMTSYNQMSSRHSELNKMFGPSNGNERFYLPEVWDGLKITGAGSYRIWDMQDNESRADNLMSMFKLPG